MSERDRSWYLQVGRVGAMPTTPHRREIELWQQPVMHTTQHAMSQDCPPSVSNTHMMYHDMYCTWVIAEL